MALPTPAAPHGIKPTPKGRLCLPAEPHGFSRGSSQENNCVKSDVCDVDIQELTEEDVKEFIKDELDGYIKQDFINRWDGDEYPNPNDFADEMKKQFCQEASFVDSNIDEGVTEQDSEDTYVMKDCFELEDGTDIRVYYGDNTRLIGYIEITEPENPS